MLGRAGEISRRAFLTTLSGIGVSQVLPRSTPAQDFIDLDERSGTTKDWAIYTPLKKSEEFLKLRVRDEFAKQKDSLNDEEFVETLIDLANSATNDVAEEFPEKLSSIPSYVNISTQYHCTHKIMREVLKELKEKFPDQNQFQLLSDRGVLANYFLLGNLKAGSAFSADNMSFEKLAKFLEMKDNRINLFYKASKVSIREQINQPRYQEVRKLLKELFPDQKIPDEIEYKEINDPSYYSLASTFWGNVFVDLERIKTTAKNNQNPFDLEKETTLVNELFHVLLYRQLIAKPRGPKTKKLFVGEDFGTDCRVQSYKEVSEAISDIISLAYNPKYLIDMLRIPYPFSAALAHKAIKEILPGAFDSLKSSDWEFWDASTIKEDLKEQLKESGVSNPDLERDIYQPAFKSLRKFALMAMDELHEAFSPSLAM